MSIHIKIIVEDDYPYEERYRDLAEVDGMVRLLVYTLRGQLVRLISYRAATRGEREFYYEEIEAAIAADPDEAEMHKDWMKRAKVVRDKPKFYMFHYKKKLDGVTFHKVYRAIPNPTEEAAGRIRIVNEFGKEVSLPIVYFVPVQLPVEAEQSFELATA